MDIRDWIVAHALAGESEIEILTGLCGRLDAQALSLVRASIAFDLLDPTYDARGVRWNRGEGGVEEVFARAEDQVVNESWIRSPFYALVEGGQSRLHRRLDESYERGEFPLLDRALAADARAGLHAPYDAPHRAHRDHDLSRRCGRARARRQHRPRACDADRRGRLV